MKKIIKSKKGFTLIEILVVIGIIAVLAAIVIVAINPAKQFAQARNADRTAGVEAILNAIGQRIADNKGIFEGSFGKNDGVDNIAGNADDSYDYFCDQLPTSSTAITSTVGTELTGNKSGDLGCLTPIYIPTLPHDPTFVSGADTLYDVTTDSIGRVTVCAPLGAETTIPDSGPICITR